MLSMLPLVFSAKQRQPLRSMYHKSVNFSQPHSVNAFALLNS